MRRQKSARIRCRVEVSRCGLGHALAGVTAPSLTTDCRTGNARDNGARVFKCAPRDARRCGAFRIGGSDRGYARRGAGAQENVANESHQSLLCRSSLSMRYRPIITITIHKTNTPSMSTPQLFHLIHEDACESQISCALWFFGTLAVAPWESGYVTYGPLPRLTMTNVPSTPAGYFG